MNTLHVESIRSNQYQIVCIEDGGGIIYEVWLLTIPFCWDPSDYPMIAMVSTQSAPIWVCRLGEIETPRLNAQRSVMEGPLSPLPLSNYPSEAAQDVVEAYLKTQELPSPQELKVSRYHRDPVI